MASSRSALQSAMFDNSASKIVNQAQALNVQNQYNYLSAVDTAQHDPASRRRCVCVPFTTVSTYTPRPHLSQELQQKLSKAYPGRGLAHAVAVTGLGGSGKTQLVLHYVDEHKDEYDTILWIDAQDRQTARSSFEGCCRALGMPVEPWAGEGSLADVPAVQRVLQWLHERGAEQGWMVVIDNADDLSWEVNSIIPHGRTGSVIITSQDEQASRLPHGSSELLQVDAMEADEAMALFCSVVNLSERDRTNNLTELAQEVIDSLDRLPLAIDLAGARIWSEAEGDGDVEGATRRYLTDFARQKLHLLQNEDFAHSSSRRKTVWTVWETSLSAIERISQTQANIYALELLALMSLLDRSGIQDELFRLASLGLEETSREMNESVPRWLEQVLATNSDGRWNDTHYRTAIRLLLRFRLVRLISGKGVTMHSLVQWRAKQRRNGQEMWRLFLVFITAVCCEILRQADQIAFVQYLISHLPTAQQLLGEYNQAEVKTTKHWSWLRGVLSRRARHKMAVHGMTWHWHTLGRVWDEGGRWYESEQLFAASVETRTRTFGRTDRATIWAKDYLIGIYLDQMKLEKAERLVVEALQVTRRNLGETHPDTLWTKASLAEVYREQGRLQEAERLGVEALQATRRSLREAHPDTLRTKANLAEVYRKQGRLKEAERLGVEALQATERSLGETHPDTLRTKANLAEVYRKQGRLKEAERLGVEALQATGRSLGETHPDMLRTKSSLARVYYNQGRLEEAERLGVEVLQIRGRSLRETHPDTLRTKSSLARVYYEQGRLEEAERLGVEALQATGRSLGETHPNTLRTKSSLAGVYYKQGRLKEAERLGVEALQATGRSLGETHPDTLRIKANLAGVYRKQGRLEEAERLGVEALQIRGRSLGETHPDTLRTKANLAKVYRKQGRLGEAETLKAEIKQAKGSKHILNGKGG